MHMDITPYVDSLRPRSSPPPTPPATRPARPPSGSASPSTPAARLAIMEAVSQAAAEITAEMPNGGVDVRLNGRDLDFLVHVAAPTAPGTSPAAGARGRRGGRPRPGSRSASPSAVKAKAEERAAEAGQSLNTWLVNVVRAATRDGAINVDIDLSSIPFFGGGDPFEGRGQRGGKRMTGWL